MGQTIVWPIFIIDIGALQAHICYCFFVMFIYNINMHKGFGGSDSKSISLWYKILLVFLLLIMVGLAIGIVIVKNSNQDNDTPSEPIDYHLPDELQGDNLSQGDQVRRDVIMMSQTPNTNYADIEEYYEAAIAKAIEGGDRYLAMDIIVQKATYIATTEEDCESTVEYTNNLDLSPFTEEEKQFLASHLLSAIDCKDELGEEE